MNALSDFSGHQRSKGAASVSFAMANGRCVLRDLRQQGSAKCITLPGTGGGPEAVFLNTSGGLTGGDRLGYALQVGAGGRVTATTQTAERVYRSTSGAAQIDISFDVGAGGHLDWLPQETIIFDRAQARRRSVITLGDGASCLMAETIVLGRAAMGEDVHTLSFHDWREVRQAGRPLHLEVLALDDARLRSHAAGLAGQRAFASVVMVGPHAQNALPHARAALTDPDVRAAASAMPGRLLIRLIAADGWPLRRQMARLLVALRGKPLPRVWQI